MSSQFPIRPHLALVDTGAYYALADAGDTDHQAADAIRARLITERWRLHTTNFIVAETHALLLNRLGYRFAIRFLDQLEQSPTVIERITADDETRARDIIRRQTDKRYSYTDATSFVVMERLGISTAFAFDGNFTQYGRFTVLTPP